MTLDEPCFNRSHVRRTSAFRGAPPAVRPLQRLVRQPQWLRLQQPDHQLAKRSGASAPVRLRTLGMWAFATPRRVSNMAWPH